MKLQILLAALLLSLVAKAQEPEQDCVNALPICSNTPLHVNRIYEGVGLHSEINGLLSCLSGGESNVVWFKIKTASDGIFAFTITPDGEFDDLDWAVYNLTNAGCTDIFDDVTLDVSCNYSGETFPTAATGPNNGSYPQDNPVIPVLAGETYYIAISRLGAPINGFTIDFNQSTFIPDYSFNGRFAQGEFPQYFPPLQVSIAFEDNVVCNSVNPTDFELINFYNGYHHTIVDVQPNLCWGPGDNTSRNFMLTVFPPLLEDSLYMLKRVNTVMNLCGLISLARDSVYMNGSITGIKEDAIPSFTVNTVTSDKLLINGKAPLTGTLSIYTVSGMLMQTKRVENSNSVVLDIGNYADGLYILSFTNTVGQTTSTKILKTGN